MLLFINAIQYAYITLQYIILSQTVLKQQLDLIQEQDLPKVNTYTYKRRIEQERRILNFKPRKEPYECSEFRLEGGHI